MFVLHRRLSVTAVDVKPCFSQTLQTNKTFRSMSIGVSHSAQGFHSAACRHALHLVLYYWHPQTPLPHPAPSLLTRISQQTAAETLVCVLQLTNWVNLLYCINDFVGGRYPPVVTDTQTHTQREREETTFLSSVQTLHLPSLLLHEKRGNSLVRSFSLCLLC